MRDDEVCTVRFANARASQDRGDARIVVHRNRVRCVWVEWMGIRKCDTGSWSIDIICAKNIWVKNPSENSRPWPQVCRPEMGMGISEGQGANQIRGEFPAHSDRPANAFGILQPW